MRYGKPIKNKKHTDPRYFLNESREMVKKVCDNKAIIIKAIKTGQISNAIWVADKLGITPPEVREIHDAILSVTGHDSIDQLLADTQSKEIAIQAIDKGCTLFGAIPRIPGL